MAGARLERPHNELREVEHAEVTRARPRWLLERRLPNHDFRLEEGLEERPILRVDVRLADRRVDTTEVSVAPHRSFGSYDRDYGGNPGHMTGITAEIPVIRAGFRPETPVVDRDFGRKPRWSTGVLGRKPGAFPLLRTELSPQSTVGRGRNHGAAAGSPTESSDRKPGRRDRKFGPKVRHGPL